MNLLHRGILYSPWTFPTVKHPTHRGPAPLRNTLLTVELLHRWSPYWPCTCLTGEYPTHCEPAPPWNTLLTVEIPHCGTPGSPWTCSTCNTLVTQRKKIFKNIAWMAQLTTTYYTQTLKFLDWIGLGADSGKLPLGTVLIANQETELVRTVPNMKFL